MSKYHIWNKHFIKLLVINTFIFLGFNMSVAGFPAYVSHMKSSNVVTGMVTALSAFSALLMRPVAGRVLDIRGGKLFSLLGFLLLAAPLLCLISPSIGTILVVRFFQGAGWGITSTACSKMIANALPGERLSEGIGYAGVFSSVATAFAPGLAIVISEKFSPEIMFCIISICSIVALGIFSTFGKTEKVKFSQNNSENNICSFISFKAIIPAAIVMTITMSYAPMVTFITTYIHTIKIQEAQGFFLAYAFATIISRPITGVYVDHWNTKLPTVIALISAMLASGFLTICNSNTILVLSGLLAGVGTGTGINALQTLSIKAEKADKRGAAIATFLFGFDIGMASGSLIAGILLNKMGYQKMFMIMAIPPMVALLAFSIIMLIENKYSKSKKENLETNTLG